MNKILALMPLFTFMAISPIVLDRFLFKGRLFMSDFTPLSREQYRALKDINENPIRYDEENEIITQLVQMGYVWLEDPKKAKGKNIYWARTQLGDAYIQDKKRKVILAIVIPIVGVISAIVGVIVAIVK